MAEAIGVASGIVALVSVAAQSSVSLYRLLSDINNAPKMIRDVKKELQALDQVLLSLKGLVDVDHDAVGISALELPLQQCAEVCRDFQSMVENATSRSSESTMSLRDWIKLKYRGGDITEFKNRLSTYRAMILIALGYANLSTTRVTASALAEYMQLIDETRSDLREQLEKVNERLDNLAGHGRPTSPVDLGEMADLQREKQSTEKCLVICADVSAYISRRRSEPLSEATIQDDTRTMVSSTTNQTDNAALLVTTTLQQVQEKLLATTLSLQAHLNLLDRKLRLAPPPPPPPGASNDPDRQFVMADRDVVQHCLNLCDEASRQTEHMRTNYFEDISASRDGHQVIVSTVGDLINAKRVNAGARTAQWIGQMSDVSLQQLTHWKPPAKGEQEES